MFAGSLWVIDMSNICCLFLCPYLSTCSQPYHTVADMPLGGSVGCASDWWSGGCGFDLCQVGNILVWRFDHEIISMVNLSLRLIQEGQFSVSGERMCTLLVNRLEDSAWQVKMWGRHVQANNVDPDQIWPLLKVYTVWHPVEFRHINSRSAQEKWG